MRIRKVYLAKIRMAVINEVMAGTLSKEDAKRKYGIRGKSTVLNWIRKFEDSQSNYMSKTDQNPSSKRVQELEAENKRLLDELQMEQLRNRALNVMIDLAEEQLKIPIRKKSGAKQSKK